MNKPITFDDLRGVLPGGDGFCATHGRGLQLALDTMTAAGRDLDVASCALQQSADNCDLVAQVIDRIAVQLNSVAQICWRVAGEDRIIIDNVPRAGDDKAAE
jgi:hypothetical protein